jgi:beta-galactosidase
MRQRFGEGHAVASTALDDRGVPYAHVGGEDRDVSLAGARWIVCVTSGGMSPALFDKLAESAEAGALVTLGPRAPESSGTRRPLAVPFDLERLRPRAPQPQDGEQAPRSFDRRGLPSATVCPADPASVDALVAGAVVRLGLPTWAVAPDGVRAVVHVDAENRPRVLFLINAGDDDCTARVTVGRDAKEAVDLLKDQAFVVRDGTIELRMKPKTVRMLELVG